VKAPLAVRQARRRQEFHEQRISAAGTLLERWAAVCAWHLAAVRNALPADAAAELRDAIQVLEDRTAALERRQGE
jgi:hypothetical protein